MNWLKLFTHPGDVLPAIQRGHRGQLRILTGNAVSTGDTLHFGRDNAGTMEWMQFAADADLDILDDLGTMAFQDADDVVITGGSIDMVSMPHVVIGQIIDPSGAPILVTAYAPGAVNYLRLVNAISGQTPQFHALGTDANINIGFLPKGTGRLQVAGVNVPTVSSVDTLSNKTLSLPTIASFTNAIHNHQSSGGGGKLDHALALNNIGVNSHAQIDTHIAATAAHGVAGDLVGTTDAQTLSNKILITPTISGTGFVNANHAHIGGNSGGALDAAAIQSGTINPARLGAVAIQNQSPILIYPPGFYGAPGAFTTGVTNQTLATYLGVCPIAATTVTIRCRVSTALNTTTWAEVGIAKGTPALASGATLTRVGFNGVAGTFNSTGNKTEVITVTGVNPGDHLWILHGSQASTPFCLNGGAGDAITSGRVQFFSGRLSTFPANSAFGATGQAANDAWFAASWA